MPMPTLAPSFGEALHTYASAYANQHATTREQVYQLLGTTRQSVHTWRNGLSADRIPHNKKYQLVTCATNLFKLNDTAQEQLANQAGITLDSPFWRVGVQPFLSVFSQHLTSYKGTVKALCDDANISERMLQHTKHGRHLSKEGLLALAIALQLMLAQIQTLLQTTGRLLSASNLRDVIVTQLLTAKASITLYHLNARLHHLGLPILALKGLR